MGLGAGCFRAEVQSIENRLDPDVIQGIPLLHLPLHRLHGGIQQGEAVPHPLDVGPVLRRGALRDGPAVEAQVCRSAVVLRPAGEQGTEEGQQEDDGGEHCCQHPPHGLPALSVGEDGHGGFGQERGAHVAHLPQEQGRLSSGNTWGRASCPSSCSRKSRQAQFRPSPLTAVKLGRALSSMARARFNSSGYLW